MSERLRGVFVVGTDTGVGKTFVARSLLRALRTCGRAVVGLKPFETGCDPMAADAEALEREARSGLPLDLRCPFRYRLPIAPAIAAERERRRGSIAGAAVIARAAARGRLAIIESAGGLASPLEGLATNLDLALALDLPVVIVARDALGTLSQISLVTETLRRHRLSILGLVLSRGATDISAADPSQADNLAWARRLTGLRRAIVLPRSSVGRAAERLAPLVSSTARAR